VLGDQGPYKDCRATDDDDDDDDKVQYYAINDNKTFVLGLHIQNKYK
jgi:hypothetical protein